MIMGNRGSKSVVWIYYAIVKEQRVNGYRYLQYTSYTGLEKLDSLSPLP
jgi:hypothetical protein